MLFYFSLFYLPLSVKIFNDNKIKNYFRFVLSIFLILVIGFRHRIGGDFVTYVNIGREDRYYQSFDDTLLSFIFQISYDYLYLGIYGVQLICGIIFILSLHKFLIKLKDYELGLIIFIPVGIIIGAMGYMAQTLALSFGLLAINQVYNNNFKQYFIFVILSILSHISGFIFVLFFMAFFKFKKENFFKALLIFLLVFVLFYIVNAKTINFVVYYYLGEGIYFNSKGAVPRFLPSLVSALLFLLYLRDKITNIHEKRVFTIFSYLILIICPTIFIASTFLDRLNIYFVPLQAYALTTFISHINNLSIKKLITSIVILFYAILLLIWLFFGSHSWKWIPYEIFPIQYCTGEVFNQEFCDYFNRSNRPK